MLLKLSTGCFVTRALFTSPFRSFDSSTTPHVDMQIKNPAYGRMNSIVSVSHSMPGGSKSWSTCRRAKLAISDPVGRTRTVRNDAERFSRNFPWELTPTLIESSQSNPSRIRCMVPWVSSRGANALFIHHTNYSRIWPLDRNTVVF